MLRQNNLKKIFYLLTSSLFVEISRHIKINFIIGPYLSFFSAVNIIGPIAGILGGTFNGSIILLSHLLLKCFFGGNLSILIGYHIPHFFALLYWNSSSRILRVFISLICMVLFLLHPIGYQAFNYALLWLFPICIATIGCKNIFLKALGSTFTAHAIGSVIWVYSVPMNAVTWISLIPIALIERFLFASGMVVIYYSYLFLKSHLSLKTNSVLSVLGINKSIKAD